MTEAKGMLTGYRVLDLSQFVAGPTCARIMGELGAEVIKVEMTPGGDRGRMSGMRPKAESFRRSSASTYYFQHNHSKKSLALDLKSDEGKAILLDLVGASDVLVENFSPGVMARMGLAWEDLRKVNPRLVMCSISLAGQDGPLADRPGFDYMGAAYAGITAALGEPDRAPAQLPIAIGDSATGVAAAMAVGFALLHRERTGEGQHVESTLIDTYFHMHEVNIPKVSLKGPSVLPERAGSMHPDGGPTGVFRTPGDTAIAIMVMPYQWPQFVEAVGMPELAEHPDYETPRKRRDNKRALRPMLHKGTFIQAVGRGLRRVDPERFPGIIKTDCTVLDFAGAALRHGTLEQDIGLDDDEKPASEHAWKTCPSCEAELPLGASVCDFCGHVFTRVVNEKRLLTSFEMTEIDLLDRSPFSWCDLHGDGQALMASGFQGWAGVFHDGTLWHALGNPKAKALRTLAVGTRVQALAAADDFLRATETSSASAKSKRWLNDPATLRQIELLQRAGHQMSGMDFGLSKYAANCHLNFRWQRSAIRAAVLRDVTRSVA